jgi:hypothetical protein
MLTPNVSRRQPRAIEFRDLVGYVTWACLVDDEAPRLRAQLHTTCVPGGAVVWLRLRSGRRLTANGQDVLLDAARRARLRYRAIAAAYGTAGVRP